MATKIDVGAVVELLSFGATVAASLAKRREQEAVAKIAQRATEMARSMLEARAGGPLDQLTNEQLAVIVQGLSFRDPAEVARDVNGAPAGEND